MKSENLQTQGIAAVVVMLKSNLKQHGLPTFLFYFIFLILEHRYLFPTNKRTPFYFPLNRSGRASGLFLLGVILAKQREQLFLNVTIFIYNIYIYIYIHTRLL